MEQPHAFENEPSKIDPAALTAIFTGPVKLNRVAAQRQLELLDPSATEFLFTGIGPKGAIENRFAALVDAWETLETWNAREWGVYVCVNATRGPRRQLDDISRVRAIWQELDEPNAEPLPLAPSFEIESSPGKSHRYWLVDGLTNEQHREVMRTVVAKYGCDKRAADLSRVLRLAGTVNYKKTPHLVAFASDMFADRVVYSAAEIIAAFPPVPRPPRKERTVAATGAVGIEEIVRIKEALATIPAADYGVWLTQGMALYHRFDGDETGLALWDDWSATAANYDQDEIEAKWPTFEAERGREPITIGSLYKTAKAAGWKGVPWQVQVANSDDGRDMEGLAAMPDPRPAPPPVASEGSFASRIRPIALTMEQLAKLPLTRWLIPGLLERGEATMVLATGGAGKSQFSLIVSVAVAGGDGRALGLEVRDQGPVLLINAEDREAVMQKRLGAIQLKTGIQVEGLPIQSYDGDVFRFVAVDRQDGQLKITPYLNELRAWCLVNRPALIVLDPFAKLHRGSENDNGEMSMVIDELIKVARISDAAVLIIHHTNKPPQASSTNREGDKNIGRGASALTDGVRIVKTLVAMDSDAAKRLGVPDADKGRYIRLDDAKANHSPKNAAPQWYKMESVSLPNGEDAPALTPATFEAQPRNEDIDRRVLEALQIANTAGVQYATASRGGDGAAYILAEQLDYPKPEIAAALNRLREFGRIERRFVKVARSGKQIERWAISEVES